MKKVIVRWQAVFETTIEVEDNATYQDLMDAAANISLDGIENTEYQQDTWEVEEILDETGEEIGD